MPIPAIQLQYSLGLPQQYGAATIQVVDDAAGGQRRVTIEFDQPATAFANDNLSDLVAYADAEQSQLDSPIEGANVGEVVVQSRDTDPNSATFGQLLFTHAADAMWGQKFEWSAPNVKAFTDQSAADSSP
jgi:hypothetical protein